MMRKQCFKRVWQIGLAGLLGGGGAIVGARCAIPQSVIVPDSTLGNERSQVIQNFQGLPIEIITGGARRGANLFHSFQEFNVSRNRGAYFLIPDASIQNILARVTGTNRSEILGRLGTFGNSQPNLFLLNPNGLLFGPNATLDVGGSFLATTANAVKLGQDGLFSASEPATSNLLSVNPSALFFNQLSRRATIINQARFDTPGFTGFVNPRSPDLSILPDGRLIILPGGLQVVDGRSLALIGGDIFLDAGILTAIGGRVELGSIADSGVVSLNPNAKGIALGYENASKFGNIQLSSAGVLANGEGGGDIQIQSARLATTDNNVFSQISADTQGAKDGGSIVIRATDTISLDNVGIGTVIEPGATGNGGDVTIKTPRLSINGGQSSILTNNFGTGKAGNITVDAEELILTNGAGVFSNAYGSGDTGSLNIRASGLIDISGSFVNADGEETPGGLQADIHGTGVGGTIRIDTDKLIVRKGAIVSARTDDGPGGNVFINATQSVELLGGDIQTQTYGIGDAGSISIRTGRLITTEGSEVTASAQFQSEGKSGDIDVLASESVEAIGTGGIVSLVLGGNEGGNLTIRTKKLILRDGGNVSTQAIARNRGGNIDITASDSVEVTGFDSSSFIPSQITTQTVSLNNQPAGNLTIHTGQLTVRDGGQVSVNSLASGSSGGNLLIDASRSVDVIGMSKFVDPIEGRTPSRLSATAQREGRGGNIIINTQRFSILDGAEVTVSSEGIGGAGNLEARADFIRLDNNAKLIATSTSGNGGNIFLGVQNLLLLRHGSQISTTAGTAQAGGNGGNIAINAPFIVAIPKENSDISANAFTGSGGSVNITAQGIFGLKFRPFLTSSSDITASSQFGISGVVAINSPDTSFLQNSLTQFPQSLIDTNHLLVNSCIVRRGQQNGSFLVTGSGGLPDRPDNSSTSPFPTGEVRSVEGDGETWGPRDTKTPASIQSSSTPHTPYPTPPETRFWKMGDPIVEPQSVYQLPDGQLVMSRECPRSITNY